MSYDVVIIGAGPAGLCLARELAVQGLKSVVVEKQSLKAIANPTIDGRDIALTHLSHKIMNRLEIWQLMPPTEIGYIREAKVLNGSSNYCLHFDQRETNQDELGYIVSNHVIRKAAYDSVADDDQVTILNDVEVVDVEPGLDESRVRLSTGDVLSAPLVAAADSRFSTTRRKMGVAADMHDFGKVVIVCRMQVEQLHEDVAYECFHYGRTLAVLPLPGNIVSVVITAKTDVADSIMQLDVEAFGADVSSRFGHRLGNMQLVGERMPYPLVAVLAEEFVSKRFALIGDAAVGMHPVTAHGFNLGLRSASTLARGVRRARSLGRDIGSEFLLRRYQARHRRASLPIYHGTNGLVRLFNSDSLPARVARDAVLRIGNNLPPLKRLILNQLTESGREGPPGAQVVGESVDAIRRRLKSVAPGSS